MSDKKLKRRDFLRGLALAAGGTALAACAPKVVKETVVVEKVVEKPVEKVVKETVIVEGTPKVVEKVVTAAPRTETVEISLWHGWTGADNTEMLHKIIQDYNETNTDGIIVTPTAYPWDEFFAKWVMAAAAGNPAVGNGRGSR